MNGALIHPLQYRYSPLSFSCGSRYFLQAWPASFLLCHRLRRPGPAVHPDSRPPHVFSTIHPICCGIRSRCYHSDINFLTPRLFVPLRCPTSLQKSRPHPGVPSLPRQGFPGGHAISGEREFVFEHDSSD